MNTRLSLLTAALAAICTTAFPPPALHAALPGMKIIKLTSRSPLTLAKRQFGASVAVSGGYAVVGEPAFDSAAPAPGAVHVFNAVNGAFIRTIKPADGINNDGFGTSIALQGKHLLVGANRRMEPGMGAAYLFDVTTGKQLRKIDAFEQADFFGTAVAISGDLLYVSAPEAFNRRGKILMQGVLDPVNNGVLEVNNANSFSYLGSSLYAYGTQVVSYATGAGQFYFFNRATAKGTQVPSGLSINSTVGSNLVGSGHTILFSSPDNDINHTNGGTIHGMTFANTTTSTRDVDPSPGSNRQLGRLMAMDGPTLVTSAESGASGTSLIVHDTVTSSTLMVIKPQDLGTSVPPSALALSGSTLLVGSKDDDMLGTDAGVAYLITPLPQAPGFVTLMSKGDAAPGFTGITHNALGDAAMSYQGLSVTRSTLAGTGSNGGKDVGMYSEVGHEGFFDSVVKSRQSFGVGTFFSGLGNPISNDPTYSIFPCLLTGPGVTTANNAALLADSGSSVNTIARTGINLFPVPQFTVAALRQAAQSHSGNRTAVRLDAKITPGGTTTVLNDTAVALQSYAGINTELVREDADLGMNFRVGQIAPRVAYHSDVYLMSAAIRDTSNPAFNETGLLKKTPMGSLELVTYTGNQLLGAPDFKYASFVGEGGSSTNMCLRVTVKGPSITAANNEVILFDRGNGLSTTLQKGSSTIGRILRVWPLGNRMLAHVTLRGTGITTANNEALYLCQEDGSFSRLLQKGGIVPGIANARISAIQRVEASNRTGHYAVLATLSGVPASANQVLMRGNVNAGVASDQDDRSLRRPEPVLRKGQLIANGPLGSTRLTSLAFPSNSTFDAGGVGNKGLGCLVNVNGGILLRATFSDRSVRLIRVP